MGATESKPVPCTSTKMITETFLNSNPNFLMEYAHRNMHLVDRFVEKKVPKAKVKEWLQNKEKNKPTKPATPDCHLEYAGFDYKKKANTTALFTNSYDHKDLIVRRSATFDFDLKFKNRAYDAAKDSLLIQFAIGSKPSEAHHTKIRANVGKAVTKADWSCALTSSNNDAKSVTIKVNVPSSAIIGRYKITAEVTSKSGSNTSAKTRNYLLPDVIVIFNPFSADDDVYMADENQRKEYVLNETGIIWAGSTSYQGKVRWTFGQFEKDILDIALRLFDEDKRSKANPVKSLKLRSSPAYCARVLSAMINVNDDNGVLVGRWDGTYTDGTKPTAWNGSPKILRQWNSTNAGVKYGQCWVFSAVLNAVLRAVGIPARPVTNFNSAHDTEANMSVDKFFLADGSESTTLKSGDSIWNFHVWNDAWMKRPDLGEGYGGWQSVDATPQEKSAGVFQCGPSPVIAIKNGEVNIGYDTEFVFGEVNADMCNWLVNDQDKIVKMLSKKTRHVGQLISTKTPGSSKRLDITNEYKYKEGTAEERKAFGKAQLRGKLPPWHNKYLTQPEGVINIDITPKEKKVITGKPLTFVVKVSNNSADTKDCKIITRIESMLYSDKRKAGVKQEEKSVVLKGKENTQFEITAAFTDYGFVLSANKIIRCVATVRINKSNELYVDNQSVVLKHPKCIVLTPPANISVGSFSLKYTISNPFPVALTNCSISLDGSGIDGNVKIAKPIAAKGEVSGVIAASASRRGKIQIIANFESKEVSSVKAKGQIQVA